MSWVYTAVASTLTLTLATRRLRATWLWLITVKRHPDDWWRSGSFYPRTVTVAAADGNDEVEFSLLLDPRLSRKAVAMLVEDLAAAALALPSNALRTSAAACHVWCNHASGIRGACVHWVTKPFFDPCGSIAARQCALEINRFADYTGNLLARENCLLHELSHVFNATIGREHCGVHQMFDRAVADGRYESVAMLDESPVRRAYGLNNHLEFFASLSVPLFGGVNDYFPFRRHDLVKSDRASYDDLITIWGAHGDDVEAHIASLAAAVAAAKDSEVAAVVSGNDA
tara:strand:- start:29 stop:883 length:855 start_codon:yes stop_codon:yes gene_type:complete